MRRAYLLIDAAGGHISKVINFLHEKPSVIAVDVVIGPHNVIAVLEGADANTILRDISRIDGVKAVTTCFVIEAVATRNKE